jgi:hypothetical protein
MDNKVETDDGDDEYEGDDPDRCESCGRKLTQREVNRYYDELEQWARRHPNADVDIEENPEDIIEVARDCDKCAVE